MKPVKSLSGLSVWLLRFTLISVVLIRKYVIILNPNFNDYNLYIALVMAVCAVLLLVGAFSKTQKLTVVSALVLFSLGIIEIFLSGGIVLNSLFMLRVYIVVSSMYFMSRGNNL